ncbi:MAG: hypothetical protein ACYCW6_11315 [Candidatus Xenobia bacterium]
MPADPQPVEVALPSRSPLWMVIREPSITRLIEYLDQCRARIERAPDGEHELAFSRRQLEEVREAFARAICRGESKLHQLAGLLCETLFPPGWEIQSVVVGEVEATRERFMLMQQLAPEALLSQTDLDLGNRLVRRLKFQHAEEAWSRANLVANFVEYLPHAANAAGVHKLITRIKAEEEIWNKVVDEIFHLDELVQRDKKLRHMSRFIKDVFGIKLVVGELGEVRLLHDMLTRLSFPSSLLERHGVMPTAASSRLPFVEVKDYLGDTERKQSGWEAIKSVVVWGGETIEIQIQALPNYHRERERLTQESHAGFKRSREGLRQEVARTNPLFGFYQSLLRWLFLSPQGVPAPEFKRLRVVVSA